MALPTAASAPASSAVTQEFLQMTDEQIQKAKPLTPGLESLLRSVDLNESVIMAFRVQEVLDKELFVALDTTEQALRKTCEQAFGIDPSKSFLHKRELAKVVKACVNSCEHTLAVLVLCIFCTCRAFRLLRFFSHGVRCVKFLCTPVPVCLKGP